MLVHTMSEKYVSMHVFRFARKILVLHGYYFFMYNLVEMRYVKNALRLTLRPRLI